MKHIARFIASVVGLLFVSQASAAVDSKINKYKLDNGLKLVVRQDHRAPVATFQIWYNVGPVYERTGYTGVSHVLEHLMFKGTKKYPGDSFSKIIAENGGDQNAMTSADFTAYYQALAVSRLPISFELEADRMQNLVLTENDFETELEVVKEERRTRTEDNPDGKLYEILRSTAFVSSPYRNPTIGWMGDLDNLTLADVKAWYKRWYGPNNATIVIVGDVKPEDMLALTKKYFGHIKPVKAADPKPIIEQAPIAKKSIKTELPARVPSLIVSYNTPTLTTVSEEKAWHPYALYVLANLLAGDDSSILDKKLVRERKLALSVGAHYSIDSKLNTLFMLFGTPSSKVKTEALEKAILAEIEKVKKDSVKESMLEQFKSNVIAANVFEKDSILMQGMVLGSLSVVGLPVTLEQEFVEKINAVTTEQVKEVANLYFTDNRQTTAILVPTMNKPSQKGDA